jgi:rsbT co-antagonist protein RsbR
MSLSLPSLIRPRAGLRYQLILAFGALTVLSGALCVVSLIALSNMQATLHGRLEHHLRLSQYANDVALQTLQSRRFEKDMYLNLADPAARAEYLSEWRTAHDELGRAISAYAQAATDPAEREQAERWRIAYEAYGPAVLAVELAIARGEVTSPEQANATLEPLKAGIRELTATSTEVADQAAARVTESMAEVDRAYVAAVWEIVVLALVAFSIAVGWSLFYPSRLLRPITALQTATARIAAGDLTSRAPEGRTDELGALARQFNAMAAEIAQRTHELEHQYVEAETARREAEAGRAQIAEQLAMIEEQRGVIREISVPILPLTNNTLVMPLVGALDTGRLDLLQQQALGKLAGTGARYLILDVTGVPVIDTQVARGLIQVVQAARLLGAEVVLVGIRPEIAQTIIGLGIELPEVVTRSSLQEGIGYTAHRAVSASER